MNTRQQIIASILLLVSLCVTVAAQDSRGSINGKVTDPNGAVLPGVTVTLKNVATNVESTSVTNADGNYSFPLLQPGMYTITVAAQGFNNQTREGFELRVADKLTLDLQMQVASVGEMVTVTSGLALETSSVNTGSVISSRQISELPLIDGAAYQLATLAPGVVYTGNPAFTSPTSNGNLAAFRANG